jgi:hypothetical protein
MPPVIECAHECHYHQQRRDDCAHCGEQYGIIYAGSVLLYVGTAVWIVRAWTRSAIGTKARAILHYIAVGFVLVVSAGLRALVASQIVVVLGYTG